ncbi:MAG: hypothetical protein CMJ48_01800 [Planctomycetaceae bacterium]|nr:hypothetical protein [Planctomycetaceae bacterium]
MVIVCERDSRWTPELQRQNESGLIRIRRCTAISEIEGVLTPTIDAVVVLALDEALADGLRFLDRMRQRSNNMPVVVVGSEATESLEWVVRESGAKAFVSDTTTGPQLARICQQLLQSSRDGNHTTQLKSRAE